MRRSLALPLALLALSQSLSLGGCSSDPDAPAVEDTGEGDVSILDTGPEDTPKLDGGAGRVLILRLYDPVQRCLQPATEIGNFRDAPDGAPTCDKGEVCYLRPDGILAYHNQDCIPDGRYKATWTKLVYSDLGPCEPIKHLLDSFALLKDCPVSSCAFGRDVTVDTDRLCATTLKSVGCRTTLGAPTKCFCNGSQVFVPADPKSTAPAPSGFAACDGSDPCKKALAAADTVKGCEASSDAGSDAASDADGATDAPSGG